MPQYRLTDEGGAEKLITAANMDEAKEAAEDWARDGSWDLSEGTIWVKTYIVPLDDEGEELAGEGDSVKTQIDPPEPKCIGAGEHDWQSHHSIVGGIKENPGIYGHGGGITMQEVCMKCGCGKYTDTWAQDRSDGEQGLESVQYAPGKYADQVEAIREEEDKEDEVTG